MKRIVVALVAWLAMPLASAAIILVDDDGNRIALDRPAQRVVTLAPHLAELVFEIGAGDALVGTVEWSDYPAAAREVPRIGDGFRMDIERIVALRPDLVLAWGGGTPRSSIERMRALGLPVAVLTPTSLENIPAHARWLGKATGNTGRAEAVAKDFLAQWRALRRQYADARNVDVFYQINDPLLFTIGGEHFITEAIETCGGTNVFRSLPSGAHAISREDVLARNPEAILIGSHVEALYDAANWKRWSELKAVQADNVFTVDAGLLARAAPRMLRGIEQVCEALQRARKQLQTLADADAA